MDFAVKYFPPVDEATVALRVQAALCSYDVGHDGASPKASREGALATARRHADEAVRMHGLLFGGGVERFFRRYERELECPLRPWPRDVESTRREARELFRSPPGG